MTQNRYDRMMRLKAVEREFQVVRDAIGRLSIVLSDGTISLPGGISPRDLDAARDRLEPTFPIRLWAEFETSLRLFHAWLKGDPESNIRARDSIDTVFASRRNGITPDRVGREVHEVRECRNALVRDRDVAVTPVPLAEARRRLNVYLGAKLPERWG